MSNEERKNRLQSVQALTNIFENNKNSQKYVSNPQDYLQSTFEKIDGFDFRWSSLITNNPLLFEDLDYLRVRDFVNGTITQEEIEAYKRGDLREMYGTFENMLVCNLKYYDRIINFCTMVFLHYVRIDDEVVTDKLNNVPFELSLTPTQIWCCAMCGTASTKWELEYGWGNSKQIMTNTPIVGSDKSVFEVSWKRLYKNKTFSTFMEYSALRMGTTGFRETVIKDVTPNRKLSQVCQKFTRSSVAITEQQLETLWNYVNELEITRKKLYIAIEKCMLQIFNNDTSLFSIYIFTDEFLIITAKFSMRVGKDSKGCLTKDYLSNSYECFAAEEYLVTSIKEQIAWAKYQLPPTFDYDKQLLTSLLTNMLTQNYKEIVCVKRMNEYGIVSKITFSGTFNNVYIHEKFMLDNRVIKTKTKCLSKPNASRYIIDRGYFIFGIAEDVYKFVDESTTNKQTIIDHYTNYSVPVMNYMFDIILQHNIYKNDIIDVVVAGDINPARLNNDNIKYTSVIKLDARQLMNNIMMKQDRNKTGKKSYWKAIED